MRRGYSWFASFALPRADVPDWASAPPAHSLRRGDACSDLFVREWVAQDVVKSSSQGKRPRRSVITLITRGLIGPGFGSNIRPWLRIGLKEHNRLGITDSMPSKPRVAGSNPAGRANLSEFLGNQRPLHPALAVRVPPRTMKCQSNPRTRRATVSLRRTEELQLGQPPRHLVTLPSSRDPKMSFRKTPKHGTPLALIVCRPPQSAGRSHQHERRPSPESEDSH
jgi:hypothetical protein